MHGIDGIGIAQGDWVVNINSDKIYRVCRTIDDGMYLEDPYSYKDRYVPWFIVGGAWRRLSPKERSQRIREGRR